MKALEPKDGKLYGYAGKILRINLTDSTTEDIPTAKYVPHYIGGRAVCNKIFWDEVKTGVGAFDPENKLIYMTGATTATGMPASGRATMCGVSPNALPEQYTHSNSGGFFGGMLKWAGYDGFILEGKAPKHTYVLITNDKVEFLDADEAGLWGQYTAETQQLIFQKHGGDAHALVIGPAGENLHRNACVTTNNDSAFAKTGFGAVFGSKNVKAIVAIGHGTIVPADPQRVLELRATVANPKNRRNEVRPYRMPGTGPEGCIGSKVACGYGCTRLCLNTWYDTVNPLNPEEKVAQVNKCVDIMGAMFKYDIGHRFYQNIYSDRQMVKGAYEYNQLVITDPSDPMLKYINHERKGDLMNLWEPMWERETTISYLCAQYGLDKWDVLIWYFSWLVMAKKEGLLDDIDFDMEIDMDNMDFIKHFMHMMVYREGELGDLFAEGMARAIRKLGKEKYGDAIYHERFNAEGVRLDIPVSMEAGWGHSVHWQGRGFEACAKWSWLVNTISCMIDARDAVCNQHMHDNVENFLQYKDDPAHSRVLAQSAILNDTRGELKDSLVTCEWKSPYPGYDDQEADMFNAVTGLGATQQELLEAAERGRLLERAIYIRNFGRTRDMEVEEVYPIMTYPDSDLKIVTWDEWNDFVDLYYEERGWDLQTGWPYRRTWEKAGLADVADELDQLGKLPREDTLYRRKENPFDR